MTPEQAKEMMEQMSPEEKQKMAAMQASMHALGHMVTKLKPSDDDPDAVVSTLQLMTAFATNPIFEQMVGKPMEEKGVEWKKECMDKIQSKLIDEGALTSEALEPLTPNERNYLLLLYLHMYYTKLGEEFTKELPDAVEQLRAYLNQQTTQLLIKLQMLLPQQRWVQPTLTNARVSALMANQLWSHDDSAAIDKMTTVLAEDELPFPKLAVEAMAAPRDPNSSELIAGQPVVITIRIRRDHASTDAAQPKPNNEQGIYEAYWLFLEGLKPEGTANSLIQAKPAVCKDVNSKYVEESMMFTAPPTPGTYHLRVHVLSTSVIGIDLTKDVDFTVVEDDVPDLE